jgi:hypothetical protein
VARALVGNTGLEGSGMNFGLLDAPKLTGIPLMLADMADSAMRGNYGEAALDAVLPAAFYARKPLMEAGRAAMKYAPQAGAVAATGAVMSPQEAEAGVVSKALKAVRAPAVVPNYPMTLAEIRKVFDPQAGAGMRGEELDRLVNAYSRMASPLSPNPEMAKMGEDIAQGYITKGGADYKGRSYFNTKPSFPLEELGRSSGPIPVSAGLKPTVEKTWEEIGRERAGSPMISLGGDLSDWARISGYGPANDLRALARPVDIHAGFDYMREPNRFSVWANNPEHAAMLEKQVRNQQDILRAVKKDIPVMGVAAPMGPQSIDSAKNMMDLFLSSVEGSAIPKDYLEEASKYLRSGDFGSSPKAKAAYKEKLADFPGFDKPEEARKFLLENPNAAGTTRGEIIKGMERKGWVDKGFPEIGQLRYAASSPKFAMAPANVIGGRMIELDPSLFASANQQKFFSHLTYPGETFGKYYADVPLVHRQYGMPDVSDFLMSKYNQWRPGAKKSDPPKPPITAHAFSAQQGGRDTVRKMFEEQRMVQSINERMLESIARGEQRRGTYGFNSGGSVLKYNHGGSVSHRALMIASRNT